MKTKEEILKGCEHDGSYIPVNEVKRLMQEVEDQTRADMISVSIPTEKTWNDTEKEYREWHSKCLTYPTPEKILAWWKSRDPDTQDRLIEKQRELIKLVDQYFLSFVTPTAGECGKRLYLRKEIAELEKQLQEPERPKYIPPPIYGPGKDHYGRDNTDISEALDIAGSKGKSKTELKNRK